MFKLNVIKPEHADDEVKEAYSIFPANIPIPAPLVLMSASPDLLKAQSLIIRHFMTHSKLDSGLLAMIRYLTALEFDYEFCINMNTMILEKAGGMSKEELTRLKENPEEAPLESAQKDMLLFALKVAKSPEKITDADIDSLKQHGYSDSDIYDAAYHAAMMIGQSRLFKAFAKK